MDRRGIVLAGGHGTRLYPATLAVSKQLLPVYDKPLIYYPLATLMTGSIREVLIVASPNELPRFRSLLGDGEQWGMSLTYVAQSEPRGIAEAIILGADFIQNRPSTLILGDNIFFGHDLNRTLEGADRETGATIFAYHVNEPERYGVVDFEADGTIHSLEEKPRKPKSNYAVTGLYYYDTNAVEFARSLKPSGRGELEISDLNRLYLERGELRVLRMGRGLAWLDAGTHDSLLEAGQFIATLERRQGFKVACPEEIAWRNGWIDDEALARIASPLQQSGYGAYLSALLREKRAL